jgi:hypothetical protein
VLGIGRIALSPTCSESGREEISIVKNDEIANARAGGASDRGGPQLPGQSQIDGGRWASRSTRIALGSTAALVALAAAVNWAARRIERSHPPMGNFIEVDGVRVHYVDVGEGEPVVLLHGNASMLQDPYLGLLDGLAGRHRVIAFDRPGFGYSERPKTARRRAQIPLSPSRPVRPRRLSPPPCEPCIATLSGWPFSSAGAAQHCRGEHDPQLLRHVAA